jgi:hypothetical protein
MGWLYLLTSLLTYGGTSMPTPDSETELSLTSSDIYLAAEQGVLLQSDAERLVRWGFERVCLRAPSGKLRAHFRDTSQRIQALCFS